MPMADNTLERGEQDIARWLTERAANYLSVEPAEIDRARPLAEYGLDSVYALTLCGDIEDCLGVIVDPTMAWDYPTVNAMAEYLRSQVGNDDVSPPRRGEGGAR